MSLNGKIAKADGSVDWLDAMPKPDGSDYGYNDFYNSVDTTIQGFNTYKQILSWGIEFPYKGKKNYVLTSDTSQKDNRDVKFVTSDHLDFVRTLKEANGQDIWLIGGGATNATLLNAKLIDEIHLYVMPIILNEGIDIFDTLTNDKSIELKHSKTYSTGVVEMIYQL